MLEASWVEAESNSEVEEDGWYVVRGEDLVAGPFGSSDEADWWLDKFLEV